MQKMFAALCVLATLLLPIAFLARLGYDLAHPETWDDWQCDPRIYGTLAIVLIPVGAWVLIRVRREGNDQD